MVSFFIRLSFQLFDRCGPEDFGSNLCNYVQNTNLTIGMVDKVDDNFHTGNFGSGLHVK